MKLTARLAPVLYAAFALSGCNAEFDDVSEAPEHRGVVGELCQIQLPLNAHDVTLNIERNKRTDLIALTTLTLSGPEITFSTRLPAGTTLEIVSIRQCRNCPFDDRIEYRVRPQPVPGEFGSIPVYMNLQRVTPDAIACKTLRGEWRAANAVAQSPQQPLANPLDAVALYIIPTDDVAEEAAGTIARALTKDTGLWIKSTVWAPSDVSEPLPGTNQYPAEDYFPVGARVARTLRDASPNTYFIVLTSRDINSKTRNFRFQYSMHSPAVNTSVLSFARLLYNVDGSKATENVAAERVTKMLMRIVGEMRLGWKRTSDPKSLMYAPVMSVEDIDRTSLSYTMKSHEAGK